MRRKHLTPQQQWDHDIDASHCLADDDLDTAARYDNWADRLPRAAWHLQWTLRDWAAASRDDAEQSRGIAHRMVSCPNNPRNGGTGHPPMETLRQFPAKIPTGELILTALCLTYLLLLGATVCYGIALWAEANPSLADSPLIFAVILGGALGWMVGAVISSWAVTALLNFGHWVRHRVWGEPLR